VVNKIEVRMRGTSPLLSTTPQPIKLVYLLTGDRAYGETLAQQINHFGYQIQIIQDDAHLASARSENEAYINVALIIDMDQGHGEMLSRDRLTAIHQAHSGELPVMYLSSRDDQQVRLRALRAGGVAFFSKPVDLVNILDKLNELSPLSTSDAYRVLVVDSQLPTGNYSQMVLRRVGLTTRLVADAHQVLACMQDFNPDLILMDLHMPEINGLELAKIIRQINAFISLPIVLLTDEDDYDLKMEAISLGADDILIKPINAQLLTSTILNRLERSRVLRTFMIRDSLTGLLNHTSFKEQLQQEIYRCTRQNMRFALAMLDLDLFKEVNDTYGHAIGDIVLKSLALLLRQRLRVSDIIGRYGGEEFVALLLDAGPSDAVRIMNEIRVHFSKITHLVPGQQGFTVTFSCGVATFPDYADAPHLSDAADRALYAAKAAGRNRVVLAPR